MLGVQSQDLRLDSEGMPAQVNVLEPTGADTHVVGAFRGHR